VGTFPQVLREIVRLVDLSDYFYIIQVSQGFFSILSPFLRSNINFEKQKIVVPLNLYGPIPMFKNFGDKERILVKGFLCLTTLEIRKEFKSKV
jgi:hypothetical protein